MQNLVESFARNEGDFFEKKRFAELRQNKNPVVQVPCGQR